MLKRLKNHWKIRQLIRERDQLHRCIVDTHRMKLSGALPHNIAVDIILDYHEDIARINHTISILRTFGGQSPREYHILKSKDVL